MANRCFTPTTVFQNKERQVRQLIHDENEEKLREDIGKLFKDPQYSDMILSVNSSRQLSVHSFILKARCPEFYDHCSEHIIDNKVNITSVSFEDMERFLSSLYRKDSIDCVKVYEVLSVKSPKSSPAKQPVTLAADLLSLLELGASSGDVEFGVEGKVVKAHRAILSARCDYFAAMFSSSWKETSSSTILIPDVSYDIFVASLHFLYGVSQEVLGLRTFKVLQFTDMYALQGMQSLVVSHLKITKCHLFHKPCNFCIRQVYECLKFCEVFYLEVFKSRCIQWLAKHFVKTLPCQQFSVMPQCFQDYVRSEIEKQVNESTAVEIWGKCAIAMSSVNSCQAHWKQVIQDFFETVQASCMKVILENFASICQSPILASFLNEIKYSGPLLEQFLNAILETLTVPNCIGVLQGFLMLVG